jgi:DNA polymerase-3 subunit alpha
MFVCEQVLNSVADSKRKNVDGQIDFFGGGLENTQKEDTVRIPPMEEYSAQEKMAMEREVTGLYLSGHPMDDYRGVVKKLNAPAIGRIMAEYEEMPENPQFRDDMDIILAGVISAVKMKPTKNGSLMAYVTLDDGTGDIEVICFQRTLDAGGAYVREGNLVYIRGRLSYRDDKAPQVVANSVRPLSDHDKASAPKEAPRAVQNKESKLYVRLKSEKDPAFERIKLIMEMFPGEQQMVIYFEDTKKRLGTPCIIHPALLKELREMLGEDNVVVK